jgi:hypothetical protein
MALSTAVKGGFTVDVNGIRAFPARFLLSIIQRIPPNLEARARILCYQVDHRSATTLSLSRRSVPEASAEREALLNSQEGQQVKGISRTSRITAHLSTSGWRRMAAAHHRQWLGAASPSARNRQRWRAMRSMSRSLHDRERKPRFLAYSWVKIHNIMRGTAGHPCYCNLTDMAACRAEEGVEGLVHVSVGLDQQKHPPFEKSLTSANSVEVMASISTKSADSRYQVCNQPG